MSHVSSEHPLVAAASLPADAIITLHVSSGKFNKLLHARRQTAQQRLDLGSMGAVVCSQRNAPHDYIVKFILAFVSFLLI